jgi:hypothetical protein
MNGYCFSAVLRNKKALIEMCVVDGFTVFQSSCKLKKDQLSKATEMSWAPQSKSYSIIYSLAGLSCTYLTQTTSGNRHDSDKALSSIKFDKISIISVRITYHQVMLEKGWLR